MKNKKRIKTKKSGDYRIITFAARGDILDYIERHKNESELIRAAIKEKMEREYTRD